MENFGEFIISNKLEVFKKDDDIVFLKNSSKIVIIYYNFIEFNNFSCLCNLLLEPVNENENYLKLINFVLEQDNSKEISLVGIGITAETVVSAYKYLNDIRSRKTTLVLVNTNITHDDCHIYIQEPLYKRIPSDDKLEYDEHKRFYEQNISFITDFTKQSNGLESINYIMENIQPYSRFIRSDQENIEDVYIFHDNVEKYYNLIHFNSNNFSELFYTSIYLITNYQSTSKRIIELETAIILENFNEKVYAIGIGYGALSVLQSLPYLEKKPFEKIIFLNPIIKNTYEITDNITINYEDQSFFIEGLTSIFSGRSSILQSKIMDFIIEEKTDTSYSSTLKELESTVFSLLYAPLEQLNDKNYNGLNTFINNSNLQNKIENMIESLSNNSQNKIWYEDVKKFFDLALLLKNILKQKHGFTSTLTLDKELIVVSNIDLVYYDEC